MARPCVEIRSERCRQLLCACCSPLSTRATSTCTALPPSSASPPGPTTMTTGSGSGTAAALCSRPSARRHPGAPSAPQAARGRQLAPTAMALWPLAVQDGQLRAGLAKVTWDSSKISVEQVQGLMFQDILFNSMQPASKQKQCKGKCRHKFSRVMCS